MPLTGIRSLLAHLGLSNHGIPEGLSELAGLRFEKLNEGWNAEPNSPDPKVSIAGSDILLEFYLNARIFDQFAEEEVGILRFYNCARYRLGPTNDEGWYRGQCRYSNLAPKWGEFYELHGDDPLRDTSADWQCLESEKSNARHFLFYLRDHTFEAIAHDWDFENDQRNGLLKLVR